MNKSSTLLFIMLMFLVLGDCGKIGGKPDEASPTPTKQVINPGDKIGDFIITRAGDNDVFYISKTHCAYNNQTKTEFCELPVGTMVNVGLGIYEDNAPGGKSVDEYWSAQNHEMYIEGYPINLGAFGTVDFMTRQEGRVRVWNVVIVSDQPGMISAQSIGIVGDDPFDYTAVVTFVKP